MAFSYEQALADHSYLWDTYGPASDMTGGYVDQDDLAQLLRSPTKVTARECLDRQIRYWFAMGPEDGGPPVDHSDERLQEIADRYGCQVRP